MAAGIFRRRQPGPNQPLRVNASHPLANGLGLFGWGIGGNRFWDALTGKVIDLSTAANATGTFARGAGRTGLTLRMAGGERGGGAIYNPTSRTFTAGTLAAAFKPAQATSGSTRPYVTVGNSGLSRGLMIGMSGTASHAWGVSSSNGWLFAAGSGVDEQVWRTVGVNVTPGVSQSVEGWLDGVYQSAAGHTGVDIGSDVPSRIWFGRDPSNYYAYPTGDVGWVGYWTRRLDRGEHRLLHEDPWSLVAPASLVQGWRFAAAGAAGDTALAGAATGAGVATGALTTSIRLAGAPTGAGTAAGALTTAIRLAAAATGSGTATGALTTSVRLAAAPTGGGTATGALTTAIRMAAAPTGIGIATGTLAAGAAALQAAASGTGTAAGSLTTAIPLAGSATGSGTATAALTTGISLAAAPAGSGAATAALTTSIALATAATGSGTATASLTTGSAGMAAAATGSGTATAALTTSIRLAGAAVAAGTAAGALTTAVRLAGGATGAGTATASLTTGIALAAAPGASGVADASLTTAIRLAGAATGTGIATGTLIAQLPPTPGPLRAIRLRAPRMLALPPPARLALSRPRRPAA
ncbi:MAG: hypothetical protein KAX84_03890 [Burkholderiales bacterium]|nr:hypothetical protein [Burkholderiales bacterium]